MSEHTPEPWFVSDTGRILRRLADGQVRAIFRKSYMKRADKERAVACVNALAGMNPEGVKGLIDALKTIPFGEYSEALREGLDADGAWSVFREAADEHIAAALAAVRPQEVSK